MDISAHASSLPDKPRTGCWGHQYSHALGRSILHRRLILSQTSAGKSSLVTHRQSPCFDAAAPILADEVERVLADIDADHGDFAIEFLGHGVLLCLQCPLPASLAAGAGARPDHPITIGATAQKKCGHLRKVQG